MRLAKLIRPCLSHYQTQIINHFAKHNHLKDITVNDKDTKPLLTKHLVLGVSEYTKTKTRTSPKIRHLDKPVAEKSKFGWTIISFGQDVDISNLCLARSSTTDYHNLCKLDVFGLEDDNDEITETVSNRFKEQLNRSSRGWYETGLLWKSGKDNLQRHKTGSTGPL